MEKRKANFFKMQLKLADIIFIIILLEMLATMYNNKDLELFGVCILILLRSND